MATISIYEGVLLFSFLIFANAHNFCQDGERTIIGSDNSIPYVAQEHSGLYLNIDNPARCNGTITRWKYCYYKPDDQPEGVTIYEVHYAIYRQMSTPGNTLYQRRSPILTFSKSVDNDNDNYESGDSLSFICDFFVPMEHISVQQGDFIGICLPQTNSLDIVSDTSEESNDENQLLYRYVPCNNTEFPGTNQRQTTFQQNRIAHFFAEITTNTGDGIPITSSEFIPPTAPAVPEPNGDTSMPTPSQISSLIGAELPSTFMITPVAVISSAIVQSPTSIFVVGDQTPTIISPSSIGEAAATQPMISTTTNTPLSVSVTSNVISIPGESVLITIPLVSTTQTSTPVVLLPTATTRLTFSTSTKQSSLGQSVTVSPSSESTPLVTTPPGFQNLEQGSLSTAATVIIILIVIAFMVLTAALVGILARKYRKRRFRFYPAFKHTILEEDEDVYSQAGTIARFDNVLYSNYTETVQIQDTRKPDQVYDYRESSQKSFDHEQRPIESTYSELQEEMDSESYSYAVISGEYDTPADSRLPEQRPYDPNRESLLSTYCAPASKESDLYDQLKLCGVKNIRRDTIEATEHLGSGQFGDVKKGIWRNEKLKVPVALKTLKEGSEQVDKVKFLQEAAIMAQFSHPNVAVLYGVVSKGEPIMLVVEFVQKGNLFDYLAFLKENNDSVHLPNLPNILLNFSRQVALGMCYLSERGFVHRDLAARNILVSSDDICKIADFGMSRDLADENYYVSHGGKIPVKWTAPEAINYKKYSTASDVWSYGCLLYEIWSLGHKPYENLSNLQAIRLLELGQRLSPPPGCPRKIYELMIFCWNPEKAFRPKFSSLALILIGDWKEVLAIPQEDVVTHQLAGVLGAPLEAGEGMYLDLQNRYVFN